MLAQDTPVLFPDSDRTCQQTVKAAVRKERLLQQGDGGLDGMVRPGGRMAFLARWASSSFGPVYTEFSLGGGARSLSDHSRRWLED
ncbi:hypothetical protein I79_011197 [Cricetulus griseus]|uniref:Uncharacterized protein n=1 Tax=Cricetulus griseus TaxID=10029 RepID=G3HKH2_CRIGR|nr:hypothetical protein I79_011197 [Cricetulus griseus]